MSGLRRAAVLALLLWLVAPRAAAEESDQLIWPRIVAGMRLVDSEQPDTVRWARHYARRPEQFHDMLSRAEPFLWYIVEAVELRELPLELALLPAVESGFDPHARSQAAARGLWQFVPSTGKVYGLEQRAGYDGRRDPVASTRAALTYLSRLADQFGEDWLLTLAAYNVGENHLRRALRAAPPDARFWDLRLPAETRAHVPRLLGVALLVKEPQRFGVSLPPIYNRHAAELLPIDQSLDLSAAATAAGLSESLIKAYNPGLRDLRHLRAPHTLLLPTGAAQALRATLAAQPFPPRSVREPAGGSAHRVRSGETLSHLSHRYGVSVSELRRWNRLAPGEVLAVGRRLQVGPPS
ncbi:MAG TPA: transglycosylase SLT domain-containing protein [Nevskiaceae bacterium]|nr:transglycosylase SLT domain-containing protein [Nevskiaceae bacterium]